MWGTFAVYAVFAFVGTVYLYFFMPETEGVPLHEIESFYKGSLRTFANDPFINFFRRLFGVKFENCKIESRDEKNKCDTRF